MRGHLVGDHTIGIYPLLLDETCWLLAVDFDKKTWQEDATAFLAVCSELNAPAALERSRSGNGGHVWIFFDRPIPATTVRKLGCTILTQTMESRHQLGLDSYDRFSVRSGLRSDTFSCSARKARNLLAMLRVPRWFGGVPCHG